MIDFSGTNRKSPKPITPFILMPLLLLTIALTATASEQKISMTYIFEAPRVETVTINNQTYDEIFMTGAPNSGQIGHPALPASGARILIPYGLDVESVEIIPGEKIVIGSGYDIVPVGKPIPLSADPSSIQPLAKDEAVYSLTHPIPVERHENVGTQGFRGYRILVLKLQPVDYIPSSGTLAYYPNLSVNVTTKAADKSATLFRGYSSDEKSVLTQVDNPDAAISYPSALKGDKAYDLLIITTTGLTSAFQPLVDYHDTTGIITDMVTTDDIGSTDPTDIRDYVRTRYQTDGIEYLIIGADDDLIPAVDLYVALSDEDTPDLPGDMYFGCLDGTYNYDGDSRWGEPGDGEGGGEIDLTAEVNVGRICAGNTTEVTRAVNKTIKYMESSAPYLDKVLLAGEQLGFGSTGEYGSYSLEHFYNISHEHGYTTFGFPEDLYTIDELYDRDWTNNSWPTSEMISRINSGYHIINHYGHCNIEYAMKMMVDQVFFDIYNSDHCFIYSQGCNAGWFDNEECWAEYVTIKNDYGAFAVVMNARYGLGDFGTDGPSQRYDREFWDAVYNPAEGRPEIGRANHDSREDNLYLINDPGMRWCYYETNLFGDPTVPIKSVSGLVFDYPNGIPETSVPEQTTSFEVIVKGTGSGTPITGSGQLHYYLNGGSKQSVAMTETSANHYDVVLPALECDDDFEYYISADETTVGTFNDPNPASPATIMPVESENIIFEDDFETDKGWTVSAVLWERGTPLGMGGGDHNYPAPDPSYGSNGPNVFAYNLNGDYINNLPEQHLTSPAIDCSGRDNVHIKFDRWLGVASPIYDHVYIRVSTNGVDWTTVWENQYIFADREWNPMDIDISAIADNQPTVYIRYTLGTTNVNDVYAGWNIDDFKLVSMSCKTFLCGDASGDDDVNLTDILQVIAFVYNDPPGPAPDPLASGDVNNDGLHNLADILDLISHVYVVPLGEPILICP